MISMLKEPKNLRNVESELVTQHISDAISKITKNLYKMRLKVSVIHCYSEIGKFDQKYRKMGVES